MNIKLTIEELNLLKRALDTWDNSQYEYDEEDLKTFKSLQYKFDELS